METKSALPGKRLAVFFDGTWNTPDNYTDVWRLSIMMAETGGDGVPQRKFYDPGVGTHLLDKYTGGAFGYGLSKNVEAGYRWLMEQYDPGDEIFVFGFSRGAFTARSLTGVIARCGLLKPDAPLSYTQLYERYQQGDTVRPLYELRYLEQHGTTDFDFEERMLLRYTYYQRNFIKMVGVWDTVGSLGIPIPGIPGVSSNMMSFHDTHLSKIVQNCYQALALNEEREPYQAVLWTHFVPDKPDPKTAAQVDDRMVEQRWFAGAHCNVGGGYRSDLMPQRPLAWIQGKATACGLGFRSTVEVTDEDLAMEPTDSYGQFLGGWWKRFAFIPVCQRYQRWVMSDPVKKDAHWKGPTRRIDAGWVETVNERIDPSIFVRCQRYPQYRPPNLVAWAERKKVVLEDVIKEPGKYARFTAPVTTPGIESAIPQA